MNDDIRLEKDDVTVAKFFDVCEDCDVHPATHVVSVDFRSAGMQQGIGRYCHKCAESIADRIRDGLPSG